MSEIIVSGVGVRNPARVTSDNRVSGDVITETVAARMSLEGNLYGTGTGMVTLTGSESTSPMLWLKCNDPNNLFQIDKVIYGWNGGSTNYNRTVFALISYQTSVPTGAESSADPAIENISKSGAAAAITDSLAVAHKWDGTGSAGMTGSTGGYGQIGNILGQGNNSIDGIAGQIILGQGDTMAIAVTPEEAGLFSVAIVYYKVPAGGRI